jgi:hypothetical protein
MNPLGDTFSFKVCNKGKIAPFHLSTKNAHDKNGKDRVKTTIKIETKNRFCFFSMVFISVYSVRLCILTIFKYPNINCQWPGMAQKRKDIFY